MYYVGSDRRRSRVISWYPGPKNYNPDNMGSKFECLPRLAEKGWASCPSEREREFTCFQKDRRISIGNSHLPSNPCEHFPQALPDRSIGSVGRLG